MRNPTRERGRDQVTAIRAVVLPRDAWRESADIDPERNQENKKEGCELIGTQGNPDNLPPARTQVGFLQNQSRLIRLLALTSHDTSMSKPEDRDNGAKLTRPARDFYGPPAGIVVHTSKPGSPLINVTGAGAVVVRVTHEPPFQNWIFHP